MTKQKHRFYKCPRCKKEGALKENATFIYTHICEHYRKKKKISWSGNTGRIIQNDSKKETIW